ncbi:hypothetical protein KGQ34_04030 [Patescibacteria group bacterium]|nr:hypothetical protein [Patescibacteria group bacterium]
MNKQKFKMQKSKVKMTPNKSLRNLTGQAIQNSKLNRDVAAAKRFVARLKSGESIPLRTMLMTENRLLALHKKIKPVDEFQKLEKDIDAAFLEIARAKIRHERILKKKKKESAFSGVSAHRRRKTQIRNL